LISFRQCGMFLSMAVCVGFPHLLWVYVCISGFIVTISFQTYWVSVNGDDDRLLEEFGPKVTYQKKKSKQFGGIGSWNMRKLNLMKNEKIEWC